MYSQILLRSEVYRRKKKIPKEIMEISKFNKKHKPTVSKVPLAKVQTTKLL